MAEVTDLEEIVKAWAWTSFSKTRGKEYQKLGYNDIKIDINWSRVRFNSSEPVYQNKVMQDTQTSKIVFTSTFENNTESEQEHSFTTERTTTCTATNSVTKGYTKGFNLELKLGLPEEVACATAGFGRETNVEDVAESTTEQSISWAVDSSIKVPRMTKTTASMVVKEKEFTGTFKLDVRIHGTVIVSILNQNDNNSHIHGVEGSFATIMKNAKGYSGFTIDGKTVIFHVEGKSKFRFGVEQNVRLDEESLE
ncbi:hypothetical protein ACF0H5_015767 [Mactra antiquata]